MLTELKQLVDLQEIDTAIKEVTQGLEKLPEELQAGAAVLEDLKAQHAAHQQALEDLKSQRRDTEGEMAEMEDSIKKSRQRLMEIKSNIEYKAMLKEIAFKEDQRDQKETRILELMDLMEARNQVMAATEGKAQEQQTLLAHQEVELKVQMDKLKVQLAVLEEQRRRVRKGLPTALLKRYEFIRQRRNGTAIAPVREGVCHGCHMNILPQQFIDLQKGEEILQCPHCQRILYWLDDEAEAAEAS